MRKIIDGYTVNENVRPIFDHENGDVYALDIDRNADIPGVLEVLKSSVNNKISGMTGMDFDRGVQRQKFLISKPDSLGVTNLVGWNDDNLGKCLRPELIDDSGAILEVKAGGVNDEMLLAGASRLLGRKAYGISQEQPFNQDGPTRVKISFSEWNHNVVEVRKLDK